MKKQGGSLNFKIVLSASENISPWKQCYITSSSNTTSNRQGWRTTQWLPGIMDGGEWGWEQDGCDYKGEVQVTDLCGDGVVVYLDGGSSQANLHR